MTVHVATLSFDGKKYELNQRQLIMISQALMTQGERYDTVEFYKALTPLASTIEAMENYDEATREVAVRFAFLGRGEYNVFSMPEMPEGARMVEGLTLTSLRIEDRSYDDFISIIDGTAKFQQLEGTDALRHLKIPAGDTLGLSGVFDTRDGRLTLTVPGDRHVYVTLLIKFRF